MRRLLLDGSPRGTGSNSALIASWLAEDANAGDLREVTGPIDPEAHAGHMARLADLVFGRWAALCEARGS